MATTNISAMTFSGHGACMFSTFDTMSLQAMPQKECTVQGGHWIPVEQVSVTFGCTDGDAENYDKYALVDDGTCQYPGMADQLVGCMDPSATNYNVNAKKRGGKCLYYSVPIASEAPNEHGRPGCMDHTAINFDPAATSDEPAMCFYGGARVGGCMDPGAVNYDPMSTETAGTCHYA